MMGAWVRVWVCIASRKWWIYGHRNTYITQAQAHTPSQQHSNCEWTRTTSVGLSIMDSEHRGKYSNDDYLNVSCFYFWSFCFDCEPGIDEWIDISMIVTRRRPTKQFSFIFLRFCSWITSFRPNKMHSMSHHQPRGHRMREEVFCVESGYGKHADTHVAIWHVYYYSFPISSVREIEFRSMWMELQLQYGCVLNCGSRWFQTHSSYGNGYELISEFLRLECVCVCVRPICTTALLYCGLHCIRM